MTKATFTYYLSKWRLLLITLLFCTATFQTHAQVLADAGTSNKNSGAYKIGNDNPYSLDNALCERKACNNSTCQLVAQNGILPQDCPSGKRYDVDPNCVMNNNASAGSCMDTMPVSSIVRVAETNCYRRNGAGGNPTPRNHLGTDYASVEGTVVTAAADGTVVFAGLMTNAGRTILMEHEKKCPCSTSDCDNKFSSVYMHLKAFIVTGGSVKKGTPIGYVGGSNYVGGNLYDYPQPHSYGPHLHFEIHSGGYNGKTGQGAREIYSTLKKSIINPLCDDIQSFCGGCSNKVEEDCTGKTNTSEWTSLDPEVAQSKYVANPPPGISTGVDSPGGMPSYDETTCDYHNFMLDNDTCFFCPMFKTLFNTASSLAMKTYDALKDGLAEVVIVAFALWIALYVLKQVSALEVKKPSKMIQEILTQTFRVLLVVVILKISYGQILTLTLDPIFNTGMNYVQTVTGAGTCSSSASYLQGLKGYENQISTSASGALPVSMGQNILCSIKSMQDAVWRVVAFGRECMCVSWLKNIAYIRYVIPHFGYFFTGIFLMIAGLLLLLAFPWCLVDCILNMAIAAALLPAAIAAWAFKITAGYLKTLFDFFLNAMFNFVFLSIILYIIITVVNQFLLVLDQYPTEYDKLIDPIVGLAFWSVNGLKLLVICLLGWVFLKKGKGLANEFAKAPSLDIGQKTGGLFAQVGKRLAMGSKGKDGKYHGGALGIVKGGGQLAGLAGDRIIGMPVRKSFNNMRNKWVMKHAGATPLKPKDNQILKTSADGKTQSLYDKKGNLLRTQETLDDGTVEIRNAKGKLISTKTTDEQGNTVYELNRGSLLGDHNIFGQKITRRVSVGADGSSVYTKERQKVSTQLGNLARDKANDFRINQFESQDEKTLALFDDDLPEGQTSQISEDGTTKSIFNKNGKLIRTQTTLEDGTVELRNAKGNIIASKKIDANGNTVLTRRHGQSVYNAEGVLLSADKSYRNPFLGFEKQTLSVRNTEAMQGGANAAGNEQVFGTLKDTFVDKDGKALKGGDLRINENGYLVNQYGQVFAKFQGDKNALIDENGKIIGYKRQIIVDEKGNKIGRISGADQKIYDTNKNELNGLAIKDGKVIYRQQATSPSTGKQSAQKYDISRTTTSLRMEALGALSKEGGKVEAFAQNYGIKRERDLSSRVGKTTSVTKDHLLSIRQITNEHGQVIQEDHAFNAKFVKYIVKRDGTIDTNIVTKLREATKMSQAQINLAIAEQVLNDRRIKLNNKFAERHTFFEDGLLTVVQENEDGSITHLSAEMIGNQMLIDMEIVNGTNATRITDNGIISRTVSTHSGEEPSAYYSFSDRITQNSSSENLINYGGEYGRFAPIIDQEAAMLGFDAKDIEHFAEQVYSGKNQRYDGHFDPEERQNKIDTYREAYRFRRQAEQKAAQDLSELNSARKELETLQSSLTPQNSAQLQGRLNILEQRVKQAESSYNNAVNEHNRWRVREDQARADL